NARRGRNGWAGARPRAEQAADGTDSGLSSIGSARSSKEMSSNIIQKAPSSARACFAAAGLRMASHPYSGAPSVARGRRMQRLTSVAAPRHPPRGCVGGQLHHLMYVYILRSRSNPSKTYIGATLDLENRLAEHNSGRSLHTSKFMPWNIEMHLWFSNKEKAHRFERYLKSGSGVEFRRRHF